MPVSGVSVGGADVAGEPEGLSLGSGDGDGDGAKVPPGGVDGEPLGEDVEAGGDEHAAMTRSTTRRMGTRAKGRIGLVGVEADVGCLYRWERAVTEQA